MAELAGANGQRKNFYVVGRSNLPGRRSYAPATGISHSLSNTHLTICAVANTIGKWIDPPATPDKIFKALGKA
jgi:hypothetical protein